MTEEGFAVHEAVFRRDEMQSLAESLEGAELQRSRAGARHILGIESIARLASDPRMTALATPWLDAPPIAFKATLFDKSPDANWLVAWHQDTALPLVSRVDSVGWGPWSEKHGVVYAHAPARVLDRIVALRVHLDDSNLANGSLRVLPGSQRNGVLTDEQVHLLSTQIAPVDCQVATGGVLAMRPLIVHASSKVSSTRSRRVLHFEYAASLEPEPGMCLRIA